MFEITTQLATPGGELDGELGRERGLGTQTLMRVKKNRGTSLRRFQGSQGT